MFIIPAKFKYKDYPLAPKATGKSKFLGALTTIPLMLLYGLAWFSFVRDTIDLFRHNKEINIFLALISLAPFYWVVLKLKRFIERKIDEGAKKESESNLRMGKEIAERKIKEDERKSMRRRSYVAVLIGIAGIIYMTYPFLRGVQDVSKISGDEIEAGRIYIMDKLYIVDSYAYEDINTHKYYIALFGDKDKKPFFISFDPKKSSKAQRFINEKMKTRDEDKSSLIELPVCVKITKLTEAKNMKEFYTEISDAYGLMTSADNTNLNAEYICTPDENMLLNSIHYFFRDKSKFFWLAVSIALLYSGIKMFRDSDSPNP